MGSSEFCSHRRSLQDQMDLHSPCLYSLRDFYKGVAPCVPISQHLCTVHCATKIERSYTANLYNFHNLLVRQLYCAFRLFGSDFYIRSSNPRILLAHLDTMAVAIAKKLSHWLELPGSIRSEVIPSIGLDALPFELFLGKTSGALIDLLGGFKSQIQEQRHCCSPLIPNSCSCFGMFLLIYIALEAIHIIAKQSLSTSSFPSPPCFDPAFPPTSTSPNNPSTSTSTTPSTPATTPKCPPTTKQPPHTSHTPNSATSPSAPPGRKTAL